MDSLHTTMLAFPVKNAYAGQDFCRSGHKSETAERVGLSQDLCQSRPKAAISAERALSKQSLWV